MRRLLAAATMSVALLGACSDSSGPDTAVGTYSLATINSGSLPQIIFQDNIGTVEITAGLVTINQDGSFSDRTDFRITEGTSVTTDFSLATGVWNQTGNIVTFTPDDGSGSYQMTRSGRTLTQVIVDGGESFTLRYQR